MRWDESEVGGMNDDDDDVKSQAAAHDFVFSSPPPDGLPGSRVVNGIKFPRKGEPGDACHAVFVFSELPRLWRLNLHVLSHL